MDKSFGGSDLLGRVLAVKKSVEDLRGCPAKN
jgi:hypothetical protein